MEGEDRGDAGTGELGRVGEGGREGERERERQVSPRLALEEGWG